MYCSPLLPDGSFAESTGIYSTFNWLKHIIRWCDALLIRWLGLDLVTLIWWDFSRLCVSLVWAWVWWKHSTLSNLNVKPLFNMFAGSYKPKPIRNRQNLLFVFPFQICQVESVTSSSQLMVSKPDKQHVSSPLPWEGFLPPERCERSHLWESRVWQKERTGCCCLGFVFKHCPSALCSWILAFALVGDCKGNSEGFY